jgi:hypothetical protein
MTDQKTMPTHTFEVAMQSKAWWYWRCTCTQWGSGYRSDSAARKDANEHRHFDGVVRRLT